MEDGILERWHRECNTAGSHIMIRIGKDVYRGRSKYQKIHVFDTSDFGRILTLDGIIMLSERDEAHYHEMLVHVPLFAHPKPQDVLVIGGGDGGSVREILRHPSVRNVDLVEIDEKVIEISKKYLPFVSNKLSSPKVHLRIADGIKFVAGKVACYDAVLIDSTDPIGPAVGLFKYNFYKNCSRALRANGVFAAQLGSPFYVPKRIRANLQTLRNVFPVVRPYMSHIPTYMDGYYSMAFCSKGYDAIKDFRKRRYEKLKLKMKYHNSEVLEAAFTYPNYTKKVLF